MNSSDLIIRKKRKIIRKLIESLIILAAWSIVFLILFTIILFGCHIKTPNMVTLYILFGINSVEIDKWLSIFSWLIGVISIFSFFIYVYRESVNEDEKKY